MEADLSPWHLLRIFRAAFGETPKEYLMRLRIERAKHLLTVTSRSVTDVCLDATMDSGFRWLTVGPKTQPGFELVLMALEEGPMCDAATTATLRQLVQQKVLSIRGEKAK